MKQMKSKIEVNPVNIAPTLHLHHTFRHVHQHHVHKGFYIYSD